MKIRPLQHVAVAASLFGLSSLLMAENDAYNSRSQDSSQTQQTRGQSGTSMSSSDQSYHGKQTATNDPRGRTVKDLKGTDVVSSTGEKLGDIDDFVLYSQTGKIAFAVVGSGGVLGVGEKRHAVPFNALQADAADSSRMTLKNIDKAKWEQAPTFKRDEVSMLGDRSSEIASFYGVQLQQTVQGASQKVQQAAQRVTGQQQSSSSSQPQFVLASDIIGRDVINGQQTVGTIDNVLVQTSSGTAAAILDPNDDFAGTDQHVLVPFGRLSLSGKDKLTTTLTRQDISSAQTVSDESWANNANGAMASVYLYAKNAWNRATNATANAADRVSRDARSSSDNMNRGTQTSQSAPIDAIRRAVQSTAGSSAQNVQVTASGNKIVLTGTVPSGDIKDKIEDRAEEAAKGWKIDNQLRVASDSE